MRESLEGGLGAALIVVFGTAPLWYIRALTEGGAWPQATLMGLAMGLVCLFLWYRQGTVKR